LINEIDLALDNVIANRPQPLVHYLMVLDDPVTLNHIIPNSLQFINSHQIAAGAGIKTAQLKTLFNLVNVAEAANDRIVICDFLDLFFGQLFSLGADA